jgi:hypothetical protein
MAFDDEFVDELTLINARIHVHLTYLTRIFHDGIRW